MLGVVLALSCALTWSISIILLKIAGTQLNPIILNLGKNALGLLLLLPTALLIDGPLPEISSSHYLILFVSGFFGIGIADAMVLRALEQLPASKVAILECLYTPFVITLSLTFLDESLTLTHGVGGGLILLALLLIKPQNRESQESSFRGIIYMASGLFTMAGGIIMVKPLFTTVPLFWIIALRMVAGVLSSIAILPIVKNPFEQTLLLLNTKNRGIVITGFLLSSYISISLWIAGYKYLPASVASVLNQTSTIFTVILASLILKEPFEKKKIIAAILATLGVIVISTH